MNTDAFEQKELDHLRQLQRVYLPGNLLAAFGLPGLLVVLILFILLSSLFIPRDPTEENESTQPPSPQKVTEPRRAQPNPAAAPPEQKSTKAPKPVSPLGSLCVLFVFCVSAFGLVGGVIAILSFRSKLNAAFVAKNRINLNYALPKHVAASFEQLLNCLDKLARTEMIEIAPRDKRGEYDHIADIKLRTKLPKYLRCDVDVYCLVTGDVRYYLLPDCLLSFVEGNYFIVPWNKVSIRTDKLNGRFRTTEYRTVMVHGRIRKDGGYDERYNTQFETRKHWVWKSTDERGALSFRFGKDRCIILVNIAVEVSEIEKLLNQWIQVEASGFRA